jgi:3-isopropylmalate dehydratase small subunit
MPFTSITGIAAPLIRDDINTDEITPIQIARTLRPDYAELLFMRTRRRADGSPDPDFVFNRPQFLRPAILVTGRNFGCGSSRESAVWAMLAVGIRCIIAKSMADIYRFEIAAADRTRLLEGLDDIGLTLKHAAEIAAFEARARDERPWQQSVVDSRR